METGMKAFWIVFGIILVLVGLTGLFLPILPGVPFLLWGIIILSGYFVFARWIRMKIKKLFGREATETIPEE